MFPLKTHVFYCCDITRSSSDATNLGMWNCHVQGGLLEANCCVVLVYLLALLHWWQVWFWRESRKNISGCTIASSLFLRCCTVYSPLLQHLCFCLQLSGIGVLTFNFLAVHRRLGASAVSNGRPLCKQDTCEIHRPICWKTIGHDDKPTTRGKTS